MDMEYSRFSRNISTVSNVEFSLQQGCLVRLLPQDGSNVQKMSSYQQWTVTVSRRSATFKLTKRTEMVSLSTKGTER